MFFFFFKQKTAYEMRISDWSSDVCSSDLAQRNNAFCPRKHRDHAWKDDIQRRADERYRQAASRSALARAVDGGNAYERPCSRSASCSFPETSPQVRQRICLSYRLSEAVQLPHSTRRSEERRVGKKG